MVGDGAETAGRAVVGAGAETAGSALTVAPASAPATHRVDRRGGSPHLHRARTRAGDGTLRQTGGGIFLCIALLAGFVIGVRAGEGTAGMLIGLGTGLLGAILIGLWDDRRRKRDRA